MGCGGSPCWAIYQRCASIVSTSGGPAFSNNKRFSLFFLCKATTTASCCSSTGNSSSSTSSYSRRWYNPLSRRLHDTSSSPDLSRHWIEADNNDDDDDDDRQSQASSKERFTVVSYNILGDKNATKHKDLYPNVPSPYLKWAYRKRLICQELIALNPDILCLQEVDRYFDLLTVLEKAGYAGSYKRRTGGNADGCATFWKADKLRLLEGESIEFKGLGLRDNVAQLSVFEICNAESKMLLVGNIHVLYNPSRGEVKLGQIRSLLSRSEILAERWGNIPIILAGDFNSTPQSAIYKFLSSSELNIMTYDRRELSGQRDCHPTQVLDGKKEPRNPLFFMDSFLKNYWTDEEVRVATGNTNHKLLMHPFKLNSSYAVIKGSTATRDLNGEPLATSYHSKFLGTVDYLWYSDEIVPVRVLDTLPLSSLKRTGGLPCEKLGSDHLALASEFAFTHGTREENAINIDTILSAANLTCGDDNGS